VWLDFENDRHEAACSDCNETGIDPAKRAELDELLRPAKEVAWQRGADSRDVYPPSPNPENKEPTHV
jgi:hypothetical protein